MTNHTKLDVLVFAAHPDDAELSCSGTIASLIAQGKKVGIVDLTKGDLGSRGTVQTREAEANEAAKILGITIRENLGFRDGFFTDDEAHQKEIIRMIRKYTPNILLINATEDRHPDHEKAGILCKKAAFLSGLKKIETFENGQPQKHFRPENIYHYIQSQYVEPDFVVDISDFWQIKINAIRAFKTQFFDPNNPQENTFISTPEFMEFIEARAKELGQIVGFRYAEGFVKTKRIGIKNLFDLN